MCRIIIIVADQDQAIKTKHYRNKILKMVQTQYAGFVVNFRKLLTRLWRGALSWPTLNIYKDTTKPPHTSSGTSAKRWIIDTHEK